VIVSATSMPSLRDTLLYWSDGSGLRLHNIFGNTVVGAGNHPIRR
jgi:hypothetical protein